MDIATLLAAVQADMNQLQADLGALVTALQGADLATLVAALQSVQGSLALTITAAGGK